jgi:hypothetical protein
MNSIRTVVTAAFLSIAPLAVATGQAAPPRTPPPDLSAVKKDLLSMRTLQEVYYTSAGSYTVSLTALKFAPTDGVTIKVLEASGTAWAGTGTLAGVNGASCVISVGSVAKTPRTEQGASPEKEGQVVCDGVQTPPSSGAATSTVRPPR